ncbi:carboxypeptidase M32 [Hoeflea sp. CAU 1731]
MTFDLLLDHLRQTSLLSQIVDISHWDQETVMPEKGASLRAEQIGALAATIHARQSDPQVMEWISGLNEAELTPFDRCNVDQARRQYDKATRIPKSLAEASAKAASEGQVLWTEARKQNDYAVFAPALKRNVALKREEASCLTDGEGGLYDSLLDSFEPGARKADVEPLLESLRPALVSLRERIREKPAPSALTGSFPESDQLDLARFVAETMGYDFKAGRLDISVHPFSSGTVSDARITTRIDEADIQDCLFSTMHEVGHALYTQGAAHPYLPAGDYCSMGVHESQSRFWENQIGRSQPFAEWIFPSLKTRFDTLNLCGPEELYAAVNHVQTGFVRTEADEVHYNLHILLRFELELELIDGSLETEDLEEAWNTRFERDFGKAPPDARLGVLQDVHWSAGLIGYFPTYSLGNIYSACLDEAMRADLTDRDAMVRAGETAPILDWLRERVHSRGRLLAPQDLIAEATGKAPSTRPLIDYLETKFGALYDL